MKVRVVNVRIVERALDLESPPEAEAFWQETIKGAEGAEVIDMAITVRDAEFDEVIV